MTESKIPSTAVVLTPAEMALADRLTIAAGIPGQDLMERAGQAVARKAASLLKRGSRILVLCGPGNNGGDGFIAARCLKAMGYRTEVFILKPTESLEGDALEAFSKMGFSAQQCGSSTGMAPAFKDALASSDLIIDALFGAGLDRPLHELALDIVRAVNAACKPVLSVDLPSGVNGATGEILGDAIEAHCCVTFFLEKPGHIIFPGRGKCGIITVADIGIQERVLDNLAPRTALNTPALWKHVCFPVDIETHKYKKGHAVVFGGAVASTGASRLAASAALRAGAGLVTLASPPSALIVNASHLTAVMLKSVQDEEALGELLEDQRLNALLIGPGFGVSDRTRGFVKAVLTKGRATVLDADALTSFAGSSAALFESIRSCSKDVVLTPHEGEFRRLFLDIEGDKLDRARKAAMRASAIVLLKGPDTIVASPDGRVSINRNAPPWLATAGSGDVLAGIIVGLLAQGLPGFEAASMAVWLHGEAAHEAGPGLISEDLVDSLRLAIQKLLKKTGQSEF